MFIVLPLENWAILYKMLMVMTMMFHPSINVRKFSAYFFLSWITTGFLKEYYLDGKYWFMMQSVHELITILIAGRLFSCHPIMRFAITVQAVGLFLVNVYQFQTITDWFMKPADYVWWNMVGFEVILFTLWFREEVFTCIKKRWTFENLTMVYIIGWIVCLAGNY